jgi:hypothetical protein
MAGKQINLELLLGRAVRSRDGQSIGRIEEIQAEPRGSDFVVVEYHIGPPALLERLSGSTIGAAMLDLLHLRDRDKGRRVPWDKLDISNPRHPRLLCEPSELPSLAES